MITAKAWVRSSARRPSRTRLRMMKRPADKRIARPVKLHEIPCRRSVGMFLSRRVRLDLRGETSYEVFASRRLPHGSRTAVRSGRANGGERAVELLADGMDIPYVRGSALKMVV